MSRVAVIGIGAMGGRIARRLLDAGHGVVAWNRTTARAEELAPHGARVADHPADAVRDADVAITMVADPEALREVVEGPHGIAGALGGASFLEMSTVGPATIEWLASALPSGTDLLDAPVLGSLSEAEAGELQVFVGGPRESFERWRPLLDTLGTPIHTGPLGSGASVKLVANLTLFTVLGALGEAVSLADGLGIDREVAFRILSHTPLAAQAKRRRPVIETGEAARRFSLSLAKKDAELIVEAARRAGVDLRLAEAARTWLAEAETAGLGSRDYSTVLSHIVGSEGGGRP